MNWPTWLAGPDIVLTAIDVAWYFIVLKEIKDKTPFETASDRFWLFFAAPASLVVEAWAGLYLVALSWAIWLCLRGTQYVRARRASIPSPGSSLT